MLRIAICDDNAHFTSKIEKILKTEALANSIKLENEVFFDGKTLKKYICQGNLFDLIYLDIEMTHENGIEVAHYIREMDRSVLLIYVSGYEQYLKELFEVEPFRFLSKPIDNEKFLRYFHDAYERIRENSGYYQFSFNKEIKKVALKTVVYFESRSRVIHMFLSNGEEELFYGKLNDIEQELTEKKQHTLRIHQSYLVNYDYITKMSLSSLVIEYYDKKIVLQISGNRQKKVRMQLCEMAASRSNTK